MDSNSDSDVLIMSQNWQPARKVSLYKVGEKRWRIEAQWPEWFNADQTFKDGYETTSSDDAMWAYYTAIGAVFGGRADLAEKQAGQ